jgi:hypothetical protein
MDCLRSDLRQVRHGRGKSCRKQRALRSRTHPLSGLVSALRAGNLGGCDRFRTSRSAANTRHVDCAHLHKINGHQRLATRSTARPKAFEHFVRGDRWASKQGPPLRCGPQVRSFSQLDPCPNTSSPSRLWQSNSCASTCLGRRRLGALLIRAERSIAHRGPHGSKSRASEPVSSKFRWVWQIRLARSTWFG